jgi:hypothetical protein
VNWRDHLTPDEADRITSLRTEGASLTKEYRTIYDRCRKRMERQNAG